MKAAMGDGPFQEAWRYIFRNGIEEERTLTDEGIYERFLAYTPESKASKVNPVFVDSHGGSFVTLL